MADAIKTKICSKCKRIKSTSEFYEHSLSKDGYQYWCKECASLHHEKYRQSKKGITSSRKAAKHYRNTKNGQIRIKQYKQSENGKVAEQKYRQSKKGKENQKRYEVKFPNKIRAKVSVMMAVRSGKLLHVKSLICSCDQPAQQYHHPSYEPEHRLDVTPLCIKCHKSLHFNNYPTQ